MFLFYCSVFGRESSWPPGGCTVVHRWKNGIDGRTRRTKVHWWIHLLRLLLAAAAAAASYSYSAEEEVHLTMKKKTKTKKTKKKKKKIMPGFGVLLSCEWIHHHHHARWSHHDWLHRCCRWTTARVPQAASDRSRQQLRQLTSTRTTPQQQQHKPSSPYILLTLHLAVVAVA